MHLVGISFASVMEVSLKWSIVRCFTWRDFAPKRSASNFGRCCVSQCVSFYLYMCLVLWLSCDCLVIVLSCLVIVLSCLVIVLSCDCLFVWYLFVYLVVSCSRVTHMHPSTLVLPCRVVSSRVMSCLLSCRVSCLVLAFLVFSCLVVSCRVVSCRVVCSAVPCRVVSFLVLSCLGRVVSYRVLSYCFLVLSF